MSYLRGPMQYYARDRFPYPQGNGGPYDITPGTPGLDNPPFSSFPVSQPGAICASGSTKLNFYRPNQALVRGVVRGGMHGANGGSSLLLQIAEIGMSALALGLLLNLERTGK
jgi:hypothetical protein